MCRDLPSANYRFVCFCRPKTQCRYARVSKMCYNDEKEWRISFLVNSWCVAFHECVDHMRKIRARNASGTRRRSREKKNKMYEAKKNRNTPHRLHDAVHRICGTALKHIHYYEPIHYIHVAAERCHVHIITWSPLMRFNILFCSAHTAPIWTNMKLFVFPERTTEQNSQIFCSIQQPQSVWAPIDLIYRLEGFLRVAHFVACLFAVGFSPLHGPWTQIHVTIIMWKNRKHKKRERKKTSHKLDAELNLSGLANCRSSMNTTHIIQNRSTLFSVKSFCVISLIRNSHWNRMRKQKMATCDLQPSM